MPDGQRLSTAYSATANYTAYSATANYLPGAHISILDPQVSEDPAGGSNPERRAETLSRREREVLALVAMGETSQAIAASLQLSVSTVETHVRHCLAKLGARNRPHAVLLGLRRGEISLL
jgi:DNA-binding NarL/FixJ family response regulator